MQEWKNKYYKELDMQLKNLYTFKEELENLTKDDKEQLKRVTREIKKSSEFLDYLNNAEYFEKKELLDIIAYATSLMESKKYNWQEINICFWYLYNNYVTKEECTMAYLVEEGLEEIAKLEILSKFPQESTSTTTEDKIKSTRNYKSLSLTPSNSYLQLAFYKKDSSPKLRCIDFATPLNPFEGIRSDKESTSICDKRYLYLITLMKRITQYKVEEFKRKENIEEINRDDIYNLIDNFVTELKNSSTVKK